MQARASAAQTWARWVLPAPGGPISPILPCGQFRHSSSAASAPPLAPATQKSPPPSASPPGTAKVRRSAPSGGALLPGGAGPPGGDLAQAIDAALGSLDEMKSALATAGATRFGSGWAWLCVKDDGGVAVCSSPNQDSPIMTGVAECAGKPILGLDVWEHAYYLKYQNRRADYLKAFFNVIHWDAVTERYLQAMRIEAHV